MSNILMQILIQVILILLNAVFACTEIAVISLNDNKLEKLAAAGDKRAGRIAKLTAQPARFLSTIQVAITLSGFLGSAFAADYFAEMLTESIVSTGIPISAAAVSKISVIIITIILSYFTLVFGELVPKRLAMKNPEKIAFGISSLITFISKLFAPLVSLLTLSTNAILRLLGVDPSSEDDEVTEEEIRMMVDVGSEKGAIDVEEKEIIQNVFDFDDMTVDEVAVHRTDIDILWTEDSLEEWEKTIHSTRHSVYPVCDESADNIVGTLDARDYFSCRDKSKEYILSNLVKPAYLVPETMKADVLFKNMRESRTYFAVALDEYGGMSGILTVLDLMGCIVGDIDYSGKKPDDAIRKTSENTWVIPGSADIDDVCKIVGIHIPDGDYDTFGGFIFDLQGTIPDDGATFEIEFKGMHIRVLGIKNHRITYTEVSKTEEEASSETEGE